MLRGFKLAVLGLALLAAKAQAQIRVTQEPAPSVDADHYAETVWWMSWGLRGDKGYPLGVATFNSLDDAKRAAQRKIDTTRGNGDWAVTHVLIEGEALVKERPNRRDATPKSPSVQVVETAIDVTDKVMQTKAAFDKTLEVAEKGWIHAYSEEAHKLADTLNEYKDSINDAYQRVKELKVASAKNVNAMTDTEFAKINKLVGEYNGLAKEMGSGPLATTFSDVRPLTFSKSPATSQAAREQVLTLQSKLEEISLRVEDRELNDRRQDLEVRSQQIARDKQAGVDVHEREEKLAVDIKVWQSADQEYQGATASHAQHFKELENVRRDIQEQEVIAQRRQILEQRAREQAAVQRQMDAQRAAEQARARQGGGADSYIGSWSDRGTTWNFNADGSMSGRARGQWKRTANGIAIKYSGASVWINLALKGDRLVDEGNFIGGLRLKKD